MKMTILRVAGVALIIAVLGIWWQVGTGIEAQPALKFDHRLHLTDAGMTCGDCHAGIENKILILKVRTIPGHDICGSCHDQVNTPSGCATCHLDPNNPKAVPAISGRYEGFAHKSHLERRIKCETCHGDLVAAAPRIPAMSDCQGCHLTSSGPLECSRCHLGETPKPQDHIAASWAADHGLEASFGTSLCASCHAQASCDKCHQGTALFGSSNSPHPPTWRFDHFSDADFGAECLSCHETRKYCTDCHRATIPVPHPFGPGWANPNGGEDGDSGGDHIGEFQAFPESCLSCHDLGSADPTCARCHGK